MQCPSCRLSVRDTDNFCSHCGASLRPKAAPRVSCRVCSSDLPAGAQFCGNCGARDPLTESAGGAPEPVRSPSGAPANGSKLKLPSRLPPLPGSRSGSVPPAAERSRVLGAQTGRTDAPGKGVVAPGLGLPHGPKRPIGLAKKFSPNGGGALERTSETTPRFDPPGGWPALREALEELDYYRGQGLEDEARRTLTALRQRHPGHPELAAWMRRHAPTGRSERASSPQLSVGEGAGDRLAQDESATPLARDPAAPDTTELSASAALRLSDLDDQEIDAALEEFGPEDSLRGPIADFEERSPNITGHTVIARNPLLMAPPAPGAPGRASVQNPIPAPNPESRLSTGPRPLARTIVTSTLLPPGPHAEPPRASSEPPRPIALSGWPMGTAVYGASSGSGLLPFPPEPLDIPLEVELDDSEELDELTEDGIVIDEDLEPQDRTLVTTHLGAPAPYGSQSLPQPILPVHVQVIGARGRVLAAFTIPPGTPFDVGRTEGQPWYDDAHLLPQHAQMIPAPGGGVILHPLPHGGAVYRQLESAERLSQGDQVRVGQSTLLYEQASEGHGRLHLQRNSRGPVDIVAIPPTGLLLGRDHGDVVFSTDTYVSSEHCRVIPTPDGVFVEDLGSSNGTYLRVRTTEQIPFGTLLLMGQTQFRITAA